MITRHKGEKKTYRKMQIKSAFEPGYINEVLISIIKPYKEKFQIKDNDWEVKDFSPTKLGPFSVLETIIKYPYYFQVACYRDGWHINVKSRKEAHNHISINDRNVIFDDLNRDSSWTTENSFVTPMMIEIANKVIQEWEQLTK